MSDMIPQQHTPAASSTTAIVLVCAWCSDRWNGERWVRGGDSAVAAADTVVSHGMCPSCAAGFIPSQHAG